MIRKKIYAQFYMEKDNFKGKGNICKNNMFTGSLLNG